MGALGVINGLSQKEISDKYITLITPSSSTFSIWSVIYILLLISVILMIIRKDDDYYQKAVDEISGLFRVSSILNIVWIVTFSYVLVDCPPSLNLLTINALSASHSILVPLQCEFFALEGLSQLLSTVEQVRNALNNELTIHGIVLTMYDSRNNLSSQVVADVRETMGDAVYETIIPRNVRISEAPSYGKPALLYDLKCSGSQAYLRLASEIIQRERELRRVAA